MTDIRNIPDARSFLRGSPFRSLSRFFCSVLVLAPLFAASSLGAQSDKDHGPVAVQAGVANANSAAKAGDSDKDGSRIRSGVTKDGGRVQAGGNRPPAPPDVGPDALVSSRPVAFSGQVQADDVDKDGGSVNGDATKDSGRPTAPRRR